MGRDLSSLFLALSVTTSVACGGSFADEPESPTTQGKVVGTVTLREGDCMPVTTPERCRRRGIATRVEAYRVIRLPAESQGSTRFVVPPGITPVQTTSSDAEGRFSFVLPSGRYSIITFYDGGWYPNSWRSDGEWAGVEVNAAWLEDVAIEINRATD